MKANEAPEKIYFSGQQQWSNPFIGLIQKCADTDIEYTRTDAFIDKAAEWLNNFYNDETHSYMIDEDIEKFINYMKGE